MLSGSIDPHYAIAGFLVGALVGVTGVGGGSLMTPILNQNGSSPGSAGRQQKFDISGGRCPRSIAATRMASRQAHEGQSHGWFES